MAIAGDIIEITYNHPTLGTGVLYPKSNEDNTYDLGGFRSEDDVNMIDGSGTIIDKINRVRWSLETTISWSMESLEELRRVSELAESTQLAEWTITHASGAVHKGLGKPVGEYQANGNAATFTLKLAGSGTLRKILG